MSNQSSNTVWHHATVTRQRREQQTSHRAAVIWFTGFNINNDLMPKVSGGKLRLRIAGFTMLDPHVLMRVFNSVAITS